jgi:CBS domain-containing protein
MTLEIKNIMQRQPIYMDEKATVYDGTKKMSEANKGSILLGEASSLTGIITERNIIKAIAEGKALNAPLGSIATKENLIYIHENDSITKAAVLMSKHNIRHLIVKSGDEVVSGILSTRDLMRESQTLKELANVKNSDWFGSD